jgi:predicted lipoprotein with Yx(FWY)xxD motif
MQSAHAARPYRHAILGALALVTILVISCAGTARADSSGSTTVKVKRVTVPAIGKVLVDSHGMTLYVFQGDNPLLYQLHQDPAPSCYGFCAEFWPPLLATRAPEGRGGVDGRMLGTVSRAGGTRQVTYDGHPLYRCSEDLRPGEANGDDVEMFDDGWYAVGPDGKDAEG